MGNEAALTGAVISERHVLLCLPGCALFLVAFVVAYLLPTEPKEKVSSWDRLLQRVRSPNPASAIQGIWNPRVKSEVDAVSKVKDLSLQLGVVVHNVRKRVDRNEVIQGITFWVKSWELLAILGPSGKKLYLLWIASSVHEHCDLKPFIP